MDYYQDLIVDLREKYIRQQLAKKLKPTFDRSVECIIKHLLENQLITSNDIVQEVSKDNIYFLTLSFYDNIEFELIHNHILNNFMKLKFFENTNWVLSFEQRSEIPDYYEGYHCHIIFDRKKGDDNKKSKLLKRMASSLKKFLAPNCIDLRIYPKSYREEKIQYLSGDKWDEEKKLKVKNDVLFRNKYSIKSLYTENTQ